MPDTVLLAQPAERRSAPRGDPRPWRRATASVLVGIASFATTAALLRPSLQPFAIDAAVAIHPEKVRQFISHKDEYDAIFVGTSRFYRHLVPEEFDRRTAEAGMRLRSFNLGIPFLTIPEARVLLDRIRRADPAHLKYVIIEPATAFVLYPENATTRRAVRLHDFETAWFSLRYVWLSDFSVFKRLGATYSIILAHGYNATNAGLLSDRLFPKPETPRDTTATEDQDGYRSLENEEPTGGSVRRKRFLERRAWFEERVARMKSNDDPGRPLHAHHEQVLLDLAAGLRSVGVETIYLIPPAGWELGAAHQARVSRDAGRLGVKLLHYNHPREHPEYFEPDLWFDISHLTREGAVRFTRRVATDFVRLVGGEPGSASSSNTEPASR